MLMSRKEEIGERIKVMRMARGMSQMDLAKSLNCGQSTVAMYETGKRMPDLDMVDYMADVFNVPPYAILYSEKEIEEMISITPTERRLISAYRAADERARSDAMATLLSHPANVGNNLA
jgi:transcriptional regulator with XRE-family HTH domain